MESPKTPHRDAVVHILRYMKRSPCHGLLYNYDGHSQICDFRDADWAGSPMIIGTQLATVYL